MAKLEKTTTTHYFSCDQCGYVIPGCQAEDDVAQKNVLLEVRGEHHFHGGYAVYGDANKPCDPWDNSRSCLMRWLVAQDHKQRGEYAHSERYATPAEPA